MLQQICGRGGFIMHHQLEKKDRGEKRKNIPHQKKQGQHEERGNHRDIIINRGSQGT
jgi:hypothetical protein